MKNYAHIENPTLRRIEMALDHLKHLEELGGTQPSQSYAEDIAVAIAETIKELTELGYVHTTH